MISFGLQIGSYIAVLLLTGFGAFLEWMFGWF